MLSVQDSFLSSDSEMLENYSENALFDALIDRCDEEIVDYFSDEDSQNIDSQDKSDEVALVSV